MTEQISNETSQSSKYFDFDNEFPILMDRWSLARRSAIKKFKPVLSEVYNQQGEFNELAAIDGIAVELAASQDSKSEDQILMSLFDNSRLLGQSFSKYHGVTLEIEDIIKLLNKSNIECFQGDWQKHNDAYILKREGCTNCSTAGSFLCDYRRETLDGLIMGVCQDERYVRHASVRRGDKECLDVLYLDLLQNGKASSNYAKVPDVLNDKLKPLINQFEIDLNLNIAIKGMREGSLYLEFALKNGGCSNNTLLLTALKSKIHKIIPGLNIIEVSPKAILNPEV